MWITLVFTFLYLSGCAYSLPAQHGNHCTHNPCENDGTCIAGDSTFSCHCQPGFTGDTCQIRGYHCTHNPCENDGTCIAGDTTFLCHCQPGFTGHTCQICGATDVRRGVQVDLALPGKREAMIADVYNALHEFRGEHVLIYFSKNARLMVPGRKEIKGSDNIRSLYDLMRTVASRIRFRSMQTYALGATYSLDRGNYTIYDVAGNVVDEGWEMTLFKMDGNNMHIRDQIFTSKRVAWLPTVA